MYGRYVGKYVEDSIDESDSYIISNMKDYDYLFILMI